MRLTLRALIDVVVRDENRVSLYEIVAGFTPRMLRNNPRTGPTGSFRVLLDSLPENATSIEVRAHDGVHELR